MRGRYRWRRAARHGNLREPQRCCPAIAARSRRVSERSAHGHREGAARRRRRDRHTREHARRELEETALGTTSSGRDPGPSRPRDPDRAVSLEAARARRFGLRRAATGGANARSLQRLSHDDLREITSQLAVRRASGPARTNPSFTYTRRGRLYGRPVGLQENVSSFFLRAPNHPTL